MQIAQRDGSAKDHLGLLARTGKIDAKKSATGQWFASESSVRGYHVRVQNQKSFLEQSDPVVELSDRPVLSSVLFNNEGSSSRNLSKPLNAVSITLAVCIGVFVFSCYTPTVFDGAVSRTQYQTAGFWTALSDGFAQLFDPNPYHVQPLAVRRTGGVAISNGESLIPKQSPNPNTQIQTIREVVTREIIKEVQADDIDLNTVLLDIDGLEQRISALAASFDSFSRQVPTIHQLPVTNTQGGGPQTLNPQNLSTETLTVSGGSSFSSTLAVSNDFSVDTSVLKVDTLNNRVGINVSSPEVAFEVIGDASVSGAFTVGGQLSVLGNIGIGTTVAPNQLTVIGSRSFTGQLKATRNPSQAHTGTWPSFSNTNDSTFLVNPSSPIADGNVIAYVNGSDPKFIVDTEGDVFVAGNLTLSGTTTQATTNVSGDLIVEGNSRLGDSSTDLIKLTGTIRPFSLTSFPLLVRASASQTQDVFRFQDPDANTLLTLDQGTGLLTASSGFNFALGGSTATASYSRLGTATTGHSLANKDDLLVTGLTEFDDNAFFDAKASISSNLQISGRFIADTAASHSFTGDLTISKEFVSSGAASNSFAGSLLISKGLNAQAIVGTGLTINGSITTTGGYTQSGTLNNTLTGKLFGVNSEFQGTASASYLLTGNTLQVGGYSSQ